MEKTKPIRLFHERCGGGQCMLRDHCFKYLIPRDYAVCSVIHKQVKKEGDKCAFFRNSTVSEVMMEIKTLKQQGETYQNN